MLTTATIKTVDDDDNEDDDDDDNDVDENHDDDYDDDNDNDDVDDFDFCPRQALAKSPKEWFKKEAVGEENGVVKWRLQPLLTDGKRLVHVVVIVVDVVAIVVAAVVVVQEGAGR